ncbi:VOC family protein [Streptomyces afghaniensis]|uniref:VOC family protein n=1 Tax=Streptomyces afghaniensis TaxID=66865 RepID=UPI0037960D0E
MLVVGEGARDQCGDQLLPTGHPVQGFAEHLQVRLGVGIDDGLPKALFQRVPEGKVVKNRVHLDVRVGAGLVGEERLATLEAECARLMALGARHVLTQRADGVNESCITMQDIEGNEFCLA